MINSIDILGENCTLISHSGEMFCDWSHTGTGTGNVF